MSRDDPLEVWSRPSPFGLFDLSPADIPGYQARILDALDKLESLLDSLPPPGKKRDFYRNGLWGFNGQLPLPQNAMPRAQQLYRRLAESGGSGIKYAQEGLLDLIAATEDPRSIPFWLEMLDWQRPRDQFARQRRRIALAALARMAINRDEPRAYEALRQLIDHTNPEIRALAIYYLAQAYLQAERPVPPEVAEDVQELAVSGPDFGARFQARALLRAAGLPVPMDNPNGVYVLKVKPTWDKRVSRTIEIRSSSTLDDLHFAIQKAFEWDADHLYSFFMSGKPYEELYEVTCDWGGDMGMLSPPIVSTQADGEGRLSITSAFKLPLPPGMDPSALQEGLKEILGELPPGVTLTISVREDENSGLVAEGVISAQAEQGEGGAIGDEDDEAGGDNFCVHVAVIGELGLVPKHKFLYLFDYGDSHLFEVEVVGTKPKAERGRYPRIVERRGKAPPQYQDWDEEEQEDEE